MRRALWALNPSGLPDWWKSRSKTLFPRQEMESCKSKWRLKSVDFGQMEGSGTTKPDRVLFSGGGDPVAGSVEPAAGNNAVDVGKKHQVLSPGR
jgi:hypothetical protein